MLPQGIQTVVFPDGPHDVERDDIAGTLPNRAQMRIAKQSWLSPLLDIAATSAYFPGIASYFPGVPARTELVERHLDTCKHLCFRLAFVRAHQSDGFRIHERPGLICCHHHFSPLPLPHWH